MSLELSHRPSSMVKIEVFNALQMRFGPSKYTSLKTTLQNAAPNGKWRRHLKSSIWFACHKNQQAQGLVTTLYWKHVSCNSCTSLMRVLYSISIFLDWHWGFEAPFQLKDCNLRALQNETHMRASILNTALDVDGIRAHYHRCLFWSATCLHKPTLEWRRGRKIIIVPSELKRSNSRKVEVIELGQLVNGYRPSITICTCVQN